MNNFGLAIIFIIQILLSAVVGIWLLINRNEQHDHSRYIFGTFCVLLAVMGSVYFAMNLTETLVPANSISLIDPYAAIATFVLGLLIVLYLYEIRHPHGISIKWLLGLLAPTVLLSLFFVGWHAGAGFKPLTSLTSIADIYRHIDQIEVQLRIAIAIMPIPYSLIIFIQSYTWRETSLPQPWTQILMVCVCVATFTYLIGILCQVQWVTYFHCFLIDVIVVLGAYIEKIRIPVSLTFYPEQPLPPIPEAEMLSPQVHSETNATVVKIAKQLQNIMLTGVWQNPDICREDFCRLVGTNRQYLAEAVQVLGFANMHEMVNYYRLESICKMIEQHPEATAQDVIFQVGFRNRTTANRLFMQRYGCSVASYMRDKKNRKA